MPPFATLTATTSGLNTPALAAFRSGGFLVVFNGRRDGKPQPEYAPFARLEKALLRTTDTNANGDHHHDEEEAAAVEASVEALAQKRTLSLLDDSLGALDASTANKVFDGLFGHCIGKYAWILSLVFHLWFFRY